MADVVKCPACGVALVALTGTPFRIAASVGAVEQAASDRDRTPSGSDQRTAEAEQRVADEEFVAGGDPIRYGQGIRARDRARQDRGSASASRDETTAARGKGHEAQTGREDMLRFAGHDRADAADDREEAAQDREAALQNRTASAAVAQRAVETLEAMSDGFFSLDREGRFTYLNPQSEALLERRVPAGAAGAGAGSL